MPTFPSLSRKATRSSPRSRSRSGGQSGAGSSELSRQGSQYRRNSSPMGVPGPTRVSRSLSRSLSIALLLIHVLSVPPARGTESRGSPGPTHPGRLASRRTPGRVPPVHHQHLLGGNVELDLRAFEGTDPVVLPIANHGGEGHRAHLHPEVDAVAQVDHLLQLPPEEVRSFVERSRQAQRAASKGDLGGRSRAETGVVRAPSQQAKAMVQ